MSRRLCFTLDLVSDGELIAEYERRHAPGAVWPGVVRELRQRGFENMEIWRTEERLLMVTEVSDDFPRISDPSLAAEVARWEAEMDRFQTRSSKDGVKWSEMRRIFSLDESRETRSMALPERWLKRSKLRLSELGFGAASLGNLYRPVSDHGARAALDAALEAGMRYIDTAPYYGLGLSERRVGDAVRDQTGTTLSTKVGRLLVPDRDVNDDRNRYGFRSALPFRPIFNYSRDAILRSWEASQQRLGLARIDILYVHDIGLRTHGDRHHEHLHQLTVGGGLAALEELRTAGEISAFGIGANEWEICLELMKWSDLDLVLLAGRYTLLEQEALDSFLPECLNRDVGVVIGGPYNSGILAAGTRSGAAVHYDYAPAPQSIIDRVRAIELVCDEHGVSLPAAALQFPLAHPAVVSVVPGLDSARRVWSTLELYGSKIPPEFWLDLKRRGLLREDAPVPGGG